MDVTQLDSLTGQPRTPKEESTAMAGEKRQRGGGSGGRNRGGNEDRSAKRRRYAAAAGKTKARASGVGEIRGPGLWLSCARRKEAISTSEAYDLLNDVCLECRAHSIFVTEERSIILTMILLLLCL